MKLKDKQLLQTQNLKTLIAKLSKETSSLKKLNLDLATNKLKDTTQLKKKRYLISVIKTLIHQKQLSQSKTDPEAHQEKTK